MFHKSIAANFYINLSHISKYLNKKIVEDPRESYFKKNTHSLPIGPGIVSMAVCNCTWEIAKDSF